MITNEKRSMAGNKKVLNNEPLWYKDAIIYELHIKAFRDSNGDGIGDLQGLLEKLDYLQDLGVTAIWLLPFYPSPLMDDGYDIADYYSINASYGDIEIFKRFLDEAHKRDLKVITELVVNHTSDQHPWFQRARYAEAGSDHRNYYVWSDDPQKYKDVRIIFTDYENSNWTWDPVAKQYYWHRFFHHQPDLNFDNPSVEKEIFRILDFWLDLGVDGFRLDAVPYLFEREGTNGENLPETHAFLKRLRAHVDKKYKNRLLLAEANMWPEDSASYFGDGDECHMNYHFPIMPRLFMSVKMEDRYPIIDILEQTPEIPETCQWAIFLRNHDELTLEMVTDEERDYMYKVYTKDPQARINLGIRHRLAPLLDNNRQKIELMNVLLFSLPGTPVLYYGDEIGMGDNFYLGDRNGVRTPMQWSADRNAGFSEANPHKLYLPVILDPEYQYESVNVEKQQQNYNSLLWWMKRIIAMRKKYKVFGRGDIHFLHPQNSKVLAFIRSFQNEKILVVVNLSRFSQAAELDLKECKNWQPTEVFSQNKFPPIKEEPYLFTFGPYGYYWFVLKSEEDDEIFEVPDQILLDLNSLDEITESYNLSLLEDRILPEYIKTCRWFGGKARIIQRVNVNYKVPVQYKDCTYYVLLFEVSYNEGLPETYQLPLAFATGEKATTIQNENPKGIIAKVKVGGEEGVLTDAVYDQSFRDAIFTSFLNEDVINANGYKMKFNFQSADSGKELLRSKVLNAEQSNTSIIFDDQYFLKIYRKIDSAINPDVEITRFLSEKAGFEHVPKYLGDFRLKIHKDSLILGMIQELVQNEGDAWGYMLDSIKRYFERLHSISEEEQEFALEGNLYHPLHFSHLSGKLQNILGGAYIERVELLGRRTAEMHLSLVSSIDPNFQPEPFSLHYQRSLFSSLQSLVRSSFSLLEQKYHDFPAHTRELAEEILEMRGEILSNFKMIFSQKLDAMKIRNHGDYHLGQVLYTGKGFYIIDFEGEPARSYSERRLKRSPLRDIAGMIRSFHYAVYTVLLTDHVSEREDAKETEKWAELWYHYISGFYMEAYLKKMGDSELIPNNISNLELMLNTFLLEKAIYELGYELNNRPNWVSIPLHGIKNIMRRSKNE